MACLVHNSRYRSLFHGVVNELRHENRTSPSVLRNMSHKCCTCTNIDQLTLTSVLIHDKQNLHKLGKLIDQINQDKNTNPKLVLALNRLENIIKENRGPAPLVSKPDVKRSEVRRRDSISDSDDDTPMDTDPPLVQKQKKPPKPLKNGIFIFLPYKFEYEFVPPTAYYDAKTLQRGRFLGRNKYIQTIEEQYHVHINMVTPTTSEQIKLTLENAKAGEGNVTIYNKEEVLGVDGEWILIRENKTADQTNTTDLENVLNELKTRWNDFLRVQNHKSVSGNEDEKQEYSNKK